MTGKSCKEGKGTGAGAATKSGSCNLARYEVPNTYSGPLFQFPRPRTLAYTHFHFAFHRRDGASLSHSPLLGAVHAAAAAPPRCLDTFRSKLFLCRRLPARKEVAYFFVASSPRVVLFHARLDVFNLTWFMLFLSAHHTCVMFLGLGITGGGTFLDASSSATAPEWDKFPTVMVNSSGIC